MVETTAWEGRDANGKMGDVKDGGEGDGKRPFQWSGSWDGDVGR